MANVEIEIPVRWGDMDALGHVNNAVFFQYCESGRMAFFEAMNLEAFRERPTDGPGLVQADLNFKKQMRYPGAVRVEVRCPKIGNRSFTLTYELFDAADDALLAKGSSVAVWVDYAAGKAMPLPQSLKEAIAAADGRSLDELTAS